MTETEAMPAMFAYIYHWNDTIWVQKGTDIDGEAAGDYSGWSVSMPDSNTVAIGADGNDGNGSNAGHVRIYRWNDTTWVQKGTDIDGEAIGDGSGRSVSMPDSNTVAIGADGNSGNGIEAGQVRIYRWDGTAWFQKGIDIDGEAAQDYSGISVSMPNSNTVAIGADGNGGIAGYVRVYSICLPDSSIEVQTACNSYTWIDSITYTSSTNTATFMLTNTLGCDSIITLDLTINSNSDTDVVVTCNSFTWIDNVTYTSSTNVPTFTLTNASGCDSLVTLNLTINSIDTTISTNGDTLISNQQGATYQWLYCDSSYKAVSGALGQFFKPTNNGNYACEITLNNCVDTTSCIPVILTGVAEDFLQYGLTIYPNPIGDVFNIEIEQATQNTSVSIRDAKGQVVYTKTKLQKGKTQIDASKWAKGVYFVRISGDDFDRAFKIVRN